MRITKPKPIAFLARPRTIAGRSDLCIAGILAFRLDAPRTLVDELGFWATSQSVLGNVPVDEAYPKPTGEFLLAGSCFAPGGQAVRSSFARVRLGTLDKSVSVSGDRHWRGTGLPTEPLPFVAMPLDWAHAFGGAGFDGNPSGKGAAVIDAAGERANPLPNVERIAALVANPSDRPPPESFLPMDVTMPARRKLAGTYDAEWQQRFAPGFPADVAPAFFNNGREDQRLAAGFFRGDETFILENVHPKRSRIESQLPGLTVRALVALGGAGPDALVDVPLRCDTVWFFPSAELGAVIFHGAVPIREQDGHDVTDVVLACEDLDHRLDLAHYMEALRRRQDRDTGAVAQLAESDLLPRSVVVGGAEVDAEMGAWTRSERLQQERTERGRTRRRGEAAEQLRAAGLDPTAYGLGEESGTIELPPTNPDDLPAFLERSRRALEQSSEDAARQALEAKSAADAAPDAPGAAEEPIGGPPRFRAQDAAKEFRAELAEARDAGAPNPDLEALAGTPEFEAELLRREQALRELYLT
ncbi:MAG: DUF2169 domain-containing protein, partial [Deltaproteobacteria bacterium]|nr:DUF2169 domain-containing protein [Deltaproteobacteria bacterium]